MGFFSNLASGTKTTNTTNKVSTKITTKIAGVASKIAAAAKKAASNSKNNNKNTGGNNTANQTTPAANESALIQWHDVSFFANAQEIRGFDNLTISGSVETEDKTNGGTKYVSKKNSKGYEASLTAFFDKRLGIDDVKAEAMKLVQYGANGQTGYLYARGRKLVTSALMLTSAKASKILMTPGGTWISCEVALTLKMAGKLDGSTTNATSNNGTGTGKYYKVRIEGMSELKVWATSPQAAVQKACGTTYTGYVYVDNKNHYVSKGKIDDNRIPDNGKKNDTIKKVGTASDQQKNAKTESTKTGLLTIVNKVLQKKLDRVR